LLGSTRAEQKKSGAKKGKKTFMDSFGKKISRQKKDIKKSKSGKAQKCYPL
jgi:hypothetical protein